MVVNGILQNVVEDVIANDPEVFTHFATVLNKVYDNIPENVSSTIEERKAMALYSMACWIDFNKNFIGFMKADDSQFTIARKERGKGEPIFPYDQEEEDE